MAFFLESPDGEAVKPQGDALLSGGIFIVVVFGHD
jgi:hypothetical protein